MGKHPKGSCLQSEEEGAWKQVCMGFAGFLQLQRRQLEPTRVRELQGGGGGLGF